MILLVNLFESTIPIEKISLKGKSDLCLSRDCFLSHTSENHLTLYNFTSKQCIMKWTETLDLTSSIYKLYLSASALSLLLSSVPCTFGPIL